MYATIAEHMFKEIDVKYVFTQVHQFKELLERTRKQVEHEADLNRRYWKGGVENPPCANG